MQSGSGTTASRLCSKGAGSRGMTVGDDLICHQILKVGPGSWLPLSSGTVGLWMWSEASGWRSFHGPGNDGFPTKKHLIFETIFPNRFQ